MRDDPDRREQEPAADINLDDADCLWNRLAAGLMNEPLETKLDYPAVLILLIADAIIAAAETRWYRFGLENGDL